MVERVQVRKLTDVDPLLQRQDLRSPRDELGESGRGEQLRVRRVGPLKQRLWSRPELFRDPVLSAAKRWLIQTAVVAVKLPLMQSVSRRMNLLYYQGVQLYLALVEAVRRILEGHQRLLGL